jgi:hypothetical protein
MRGALRESNGMLLVCGSGNPVREGEVLVADLADDGEDEPDVGMYKGPPVICADLSSERTWDEAWREKAEGGASSSR